MPRVCRQLRLLSRSLNLLPAPTNVPPAWALDDSRHEAIEFSAGTFTPAGYGPDSANGWCTALTLCSDDPLFGSVFSLTYVRRLRHHNQHNLDLDVTGYVGTQSVDGPTRTFGMLSIVPTYRIRLPGKLSFLTAGIGAGLNVALGDMPSEDPNVPVNSQLNLELALTPSANSKFERTVALSSACSTRWMAASVAASGTPWGCANGFDLPPRPLSRCRRASHAVPGWPWHPGWPAPLR